MAIGWINKSTMPADRTTFAENPGMSKAVRRYGKDGARLDSTYGSTGGHEAHEDEVRPSDPAHSNTKRVPVGGVVKTVGFAPDGSGRYSLPDYAKTTRAHDGGHESARGASTDGASGQAYAASGGKFGKPTQRPSASSNTGTRAAHGARLDGGKKL
jgi:hypothetical protein